jgi:O-antigen/teichoic acid export membrane protein
MSLRIYTAYTLAGQVTALALALLTIPSYLGTVGEARFGVLAIAWLLIVYFGLFDLGLGAAAAQRLARLAPDDRAAQAPLFWSALLTGLLVSTIGALGLWPLAHGLLSHALPMDAVLREELLAGLPWLLMTVPVVTACNILTGALQARERFLELSLAAVLGSAGLQALPLLTALYVSPRLDLLLLSTLAGKVGTAVYLALCCQRHVTRQLPVIWRLDAVRDLLQFGGWTSVTAVVGPMMVVLDRLVIGATLGARSVSHYTIPFQLAERTTVLAAALSYTLLPRMARAGTTPEREALALGALRLLATLMTPLVALAMVLVGPFLGWWVNDELAAISTPVALVLLAGFWVNSLAFVPYTLLQSAGRPDIIARCHLAELLPYLGLLFLGLQHGALVGAAAAFALRAAVDFVLLAHFGGLLARSGGVLLPGAGLLLIAAHGGQGITAWAACAALCGLSAVNARNAGRTLHVASP